MSNQDAGPMVGALGAGTRKGLNVRNASLLCHVIVYFAHDHIDLIPSCCSGWDGVDRAHMFEGEPAVLDPNDPRRGSVSPVPRFPDDVSHQEWIYRF